MRLKPEDFSSCTPCVSDPTKENQVHRVDLQHMMQQLDEYLNQSDYVAALQHLKFWLSEAEHYNDMQGMLAAYNELMDLHCRLGHKDAAINAVSHALRLIVRPALNGTVAAGTTCANAAAVYQAFGLVDKALPL